jgi:hypothetical protein
VWQHLVRQLDRQDDSISLARINLQGEVLNWYLNIDRKCNPKVGFIRQRSGADTRFSCAAIILT